MCAYLMLGILRNRLKIPLTGGIQYIEAIVADYDIASTLLTSIASPILYLGTVTFAGQKRPVEFVWTFYRPDQFRYSVKLGLKGNSHEERGSRMCDHHGT